MSSAREIHQGKERLSSEPYLDHPLAVAGILARMKLDEETIAAGLLHDVMEEQCATPEELEENFGAEVTRIVQGVTEAQPVGFQ